MGSKVAAAVYLVVLIVVVVGVDVVFFRHHAGTRLIANIAIVVVFASFYWALLRRR